MNTFTHLCRSAAVALLVGLLGCTGVVPALATTPKDLKITLPTEPVLVTPIAVSGKNLLVESDGRYRLSHDNGKHWITAKVEWPCSPNCTNSGDSWIGKVADGVVTTYSSYPRTLDAYSLVTNARVGTSYHVPDGRAVYGLKGDLALLRNSAGGGTVLSLTTGATHEVAAQADRDLVDVLPDGSVLARSKYQAAKGWATISPTGEIRTILPGDSGSQLSSGNLLAFEVVTNGKTTFCLVQLGQPGSSCRAGRSNERLHALGSSGLIVKRLYGGAAHIYPVKAGKLGAPRTVGAKLRANHYAFALSTENAYPVISQTNTTSTWLDRVKPTGKVAKVTLGWARQPVVPTALALTPTAILGNYSTEGLRYSWWRSAGAKLGGQNRLGVDNYPQLSASGARWAISEDGRGLRIYDRAVRTHNLRSTYADDVARQSGPYLLAYPHCSSSGDSHESCPPPRVLDTAGRVLVTPANAWDIFGTLAVEATDTKGKLKVADFLDAKAPVIDIALADPGQYGYYEDTQIWGDWVAATKRSGSEWWVVAHNYRTGVTLTAPQRGSLLALGDGFAVLNDYETTLKAWNFADGTMTALAPTGNKGASTVATDGSRVAYVNGGSLVIKTIPGAGKSAPRVLGVVAPTTLKGTWKAAIDLTKAVRSGRLEIRNSAGTLVRSLSVKASKDGSLRGITWNGRDKAGKRVAAGRYTFTLTNRAADGTGAIRLVDGTVGPIGTIQVP